MSRQQQTKALLVLRLLANGQQAYSMYFGGVEEADQEKEIYDGEGATEVLRAWVKETISYELCHGPPVNKIPEV